MWFWIWTFLVLAALGVLAWFVVELVRRGFRLGRALSAAADELGAAFDVVDDRTVALVAAQPAPRTTVFDDPRRLRYVQQGAKAERRRRRWERHAPTRAAWLATFRD
ncbi:hypothetical protein GCM10011331_17360 [Flavimobilis marinus]|uniref:Uncharacterized protein n=1 Tax=Flavimobilis marinus TaxID=285351 RepID=A0A1I2FD29_9MICO|nr:hypothetical protein [Flavimobilis marinus]GHG52499.1 hypothetical protein GCM10011331_17360 [Flavimobilis marinus]SFF02436.1 hypothetical protein SAMN04488035_1222 [Flavimobilis marinus]